MPSVYTFSHTNNELLQEMLKVLGTSGGSFREQWSIQAEAVVEPIGWEALWKMSKEFCQKLGVRFPCVAQVCILGVDWEGLSASLEVREVQHEKVQLPSRLDDVPLVELWPTQHQSEACIDAHSTAEFIHLLRFYHNNIWMPWDDMDDKSILPATLEERMRLWASLHDGSMPMRVARKVTLLRNEAVSVYGKIREAEEMIPADLHGDDDDSMLPEKYVSRCAELHARLDYLLSKWTTFENPHVRSAYLAEEERKAKSLNKNIVSILWKGGPMFELQQLCVEVGRCVGAEQSVCVCWSPEEAFCVEPRQIFVCLHTLEMPDIPLNEICVRGIGGTTVISPEVRSCLITVTSDCELRDLTLKCSQTNTSVLVRQANLKLAGCRVTDDSTSHQTDFAQGLVAMGGSKVVVENCEFRNLYTAMVVHCGAEVELVNCTIENCGVGIQMYEGSRVKINDTVINGCDEQCVRVEVSTQAEIKDGNSITGLEISPTCRIGKGTSNEICVIRQETQLS